MVWMTNEADFLARSAQHGLSMLMVIMSLINSSVEASFASIFTVGWYALTIGSEAGS